MQKIFTEDPDYEQWQMLSNFIYPSNIKRFFEDRGIKNYEQELVELISGSILQAQEYFYANTLVSLNTSPLLLYYGVVNLLFATSLLESGKKVPIEKHGIKLESTTGGRLATTKFTPYFSTERGGLFQFCKTFCPDPKISSYSGKDKWTLQEILGSIPELKQDFEVCYKEAEAEFYVIPLQIVKSKTDYVERIDLKNFRNRSTVMEELLKVDGFPNSYLNPKLESDLFIFLRAKLGSQPITQTSIFGQLFLQKSHQKTNRITLPTIIYMYMGLFVLGYLSRYKPDIWIPFVRSDSTGEKQVVEKFLKICKRALPNMALNFIHKKNFYFVKEMYEPLDLSKEVTEEEIRKIVVDEIKKYR